MRAAIERAVKDLADTLEGIAAAHREVLLDNICKANLYVSDGGIKDEKKTLLIYPLSEIENGNIERVQKGEMLKVGNTRAKVKQAYMKWADGISLTEARQCMGEEVSLKEFEAYWEDEWGSADTPVYIIEVELW